MKKTTKFQQKTVSPSRISTRDEIENVANRCTEQNCIKDDDKMRLECHKCQRTLHYACTGLPSYQIQMFLNKGYRKYQCINCCSIDQELHRKILDQSEKIKSCTHSRKEIEACENIIKVKNENERKLNVAVKELQARCQGYVKERNHVADTIQAQFLALETKLTTKIEDTMNAKPTDNKTKTNSKKSFAEITKTNDELNISSMKQILRSEKVEEQMEEQRKQSREANIIIHGVEENGNRDENDFVNELLNDVKINTEPTYVSRIGKESNRTRPIKVVFNGGHVKYKFMRNLRELKQYDKYANMSITDDLTIMERDQVKEWRSKANERNRAMPQSDYKWRVRGSPQGGLYLKKIFCKTRSV